MDIEDIPPEVDFVLLSHYHGDHFDHLVEEELDKTLPIVTTHHAADNLEEKGFQETYPLDTWDTIAISKGEVELDITRCPGHRAERERDHEPVANQTPRDERSQRRADAERHRENRQLCFRLATPSEVARKREGGGEHHRAGDPLGESGENHLPRGDDETLRERGRYQQNQSPNLKSGR